MADPSEFTPEELADIADAAFKLAMPEHGQKMIDAAFAVLDQVPCKNLRGTFGEIQRAALLFADSAGLSQSQRVLLRVAYVVFPLVVLCIMHCRQTAVFPNAICAHAFGKLVAHRELDSRAI